MGRKTFILLALTPLMLFLSFPLPVAATSVCTCTYTRTSVSSGKTSSESTYEVSSYGGATISTSSACQLGCDAWATGKTVDSGGALTYTITESSYAEVATTDTDSTSAPTSRKLLTPVLSVDIPTVKFTDVLETVGEDGATYLSINYLGDYIAGVYKYLLGISTTIAIVMLMIGGLQYTIFQEDKAKTRIKNAVTGLVLLLSTYLILSTINPNLIKLTFPKLKLIQEVPLENLVESDADAAECSGDLTGVSDIQDCMLNTYGESKDKVELVQVKYKNRSYQVHKLMAEDFQKALDAIDASGTSYDITTETAGGTQNWRCNKTNTKALSFHAWGTAIDINPSMNPYCPPKCLDDSASTACSCVGGTSTDSCETMCGTQQYDLPQEVIDAFKSNNFKWGGDYNSLKDYMHFDYVKNCFS